MIILASINWMAWMGKSSHRCWSGDRKCWVRAHSCEALWPPQENLAKADMMHCYELHSVILLYIFSSLELTSRFCNMIPYRLRISSKGRIALLCLRSDPMATIFTNQPQLAHFSLYPRSPRRILVIYSLVAKCMCPQDGKHPENETSCWWTWVGQGKADAPLWLQV